MRQPGRANAIAAKDMVDFPDPDSPISATTSPAFTSKLMSFTIGM
jgi:hypothetical protein